MGNIHVLDMSVANLIAAGEVVERPASAIKELVENAIDAGAHTVTVEIKRGGVSFIRVTDDGCGMSDTDAVSCLQRHATSKIHTADDLSHIMTLGFRGEALAAISSVTDLRIMTRHEGEEVGTLVHCEYGKVTEVREGGYPVGTTVIAENLFARVPARLKFLHSDQSEGMAVASLMEKMALSHPEISFKLISDESMRFQTVGDGNLKNAVYSVFGRGFASALTEVGAKSGGISVSGFISTPENVRGNRNMQMFFINSRLIRSKSLTAALENAYTSYIPVGKFPSCILFLSLHASSVDVNIHPAKLEVKFSNEKEIFDAVYYSVRGALEAKIARPALETLSKAGVMTDEKLRIVTGFSEIGREKPERLSFADLPKQTSEKSVPSPSSRSLELSAQPIKKDDNSKGNEGSGEKQTFAGERELPDIPIRDLFPSSPLHEPSTFDFSAGMGIKKVSSSFTLPSQRETEKTEGEAKPNMADLAAKTMETDAFAAEQKQTDSEKKSFYSDTDASIPGMESREIPPYKIVGEVFCSYVILEVGDKMLLVDKHAAHERINYERLRANMQEKAPAVQTLLVPETLTLSPEEADALFRFREEIASVGFLFDASDNGAVIRGIPPDCDVKTALDLLDLLVSAASEDGAALEAKKRTIFEKALYQASCKAAIKAGRRYDEVHIKWICDNLLRYDCIKYCPHGRPVAFEMTKQELDHRFKRS